MFYTLPEAPLAVAMGRATPQAVNVSWQHPPGGAYKYRLDMLLLPSTVAQIPASHAGLLHDLRVLAGEAGVQRLAPSFRVTHEGREPCARLAGLRPGAQYAFLVRAVNRDFVAGAGGQLPPHRADFLSDVRRRTDDATLLPRARVRMTRCRAAQYTYGTMRAGTIAQYYSQSAPYFAAHLRSSRSWRCTSRAAK